MENRPDKKTAKAQARPYAKAAFEYARDNKQIGDWEFKLEVLALLLADEDTQRILRDPVFGKKQITQIMSRALDTIEASPQQRNLVNLLIKDGRLQLLPSIYESYVQQRKEAEGIIDVRIVSAVELTPNQLDNLKDTLKKRFNVKAAPQVEVDPSLLGGVKLIIGDRVYDQTLKGQLDRLEKFLKGPE